MSNDVFASYATSGAFRIDLSRPMVSSLFFAANGGELTGGTYRGMYSAAEALLRRGLVEKIPHNGRSEVSRLYPPMRITEAGIAVARLCEMAGLGIIAADRHEGAAQ